MAERTIAFLADGLHGSVAGQSRYRVLRRINQSYKPSHIDDQGLVEGSRCMGCNTRLKYRCWVEMVDADDDEGLSDKMIFLGSECIKIVANELPKFHAHFKPSLARYKRTRRLLASSTRV